MKVLKLEPIMSDEEVAKLEGTHLKDSDCKILIEYDCDVFDKETGVCIAKFRKKVIPKKVQQITFKCLLSAASPTSNRTQGGGEFKEDNNVKKLSKNLVRVFKKDGTISNTNRGTVINSGIIGSFDRTPRFPYCRQTAFNAKKFNQFKKAYPIIKIVDSLYSKLMPIKYKLQREIADKTSQDFVIKNTAFTTVTVNKNWQTAVHTDKGDFKEGFGNLTALRLGRFDGGFFVLPKWGVGFDLRNGDILLVDVHQLHGNTPIRLIDKNATRLSLVMYYRENMIHCGTAKQELIIAKKRKKGEHLNE